MKYFVFTLLSVLLTSFYLELFHNEVPCTFCSLQRALLLTTAIGPCLSCRYGNHPTHHTLTLLSALLGIAISVTQISYHACPEFPIFGVPALRLSLYTWSFIIFCCSILATALLLGRPVKHTKIPTLFAILVSIAFIFIYLQQM